MKHLDIAATQGLGLPAGQIVVWLLETFVLADPIPSQVAIAIGTVLGGLVQFLKVRFYDESSAKTSD